MYTDAATASAPSCTALIAIQSACFSQGAVTLRGGGARTSKVELNADRLKQPLGHGQRKDIVTVTSSVPVPASVWKHHTVKIAGYLVLWYT